MAQEKTTKVKTTKQAVEVKTAEQLQKELAAKRADLLEARRGLAAGELANPHILTVTRKEIARLLTAIRAHELAEQERSK